MKEIIKKVDEDRIYENLRTSRLSRIYENLRTSRPSSEVHDKARKIRRLEEAIQYENEPKATSISSSTWEILLKSINLLSKYARNKAILDEGRKDWLEIIVRSPIKLFWIFFGFMFMAFALCYLYSLFK